MAYPGSGVTSRLQVPSSSTRPDPDAALVPQLSSDLSPATLRRVARLERADSPRTAASSAPADDAVSRQWNPVVRCARHHSPEGIPVPTCLGLPRPSARTAVVSLPVSYTHLRAHETPEHLV